MKISSCIYNKLIKPINFNGQNSANKTEYNPEQQSKSVLGVYYQPVSLYRNADLQMFWDDIKYENPEKEYFNSDRGPYIAPNIEAIRKLSILDNLSLRQKKEFIDLFCKETGFPDLDKVKQKAESEIEKSIHFLAQKEDFDVKFIGYDKNSSIGRGVAIPGSDCDALFMIIDPKEHKEPWYPGAIRWQFKDYVNQRVLCTHASGLPEVLSVSYIEEGLKLADEAFQKAEFSSEDIERFEKNLADDTNDFVKSAEFNIRLASFIPKDDDKRTQYYKSAMLVELIRDGIVNENNFSSDFMQKVQKSPLYRFSNLMKQQGLSNKLKAKHQKRLQLINDFKSMSIDEQFNIVRDMIYFSFMQKNYKHKEYFENIDSNNKNEMGNITEMYALILNV